MVIKFKTQFDEKQYKALGLNEETLHRRLSLLKDRVKDKKKSLEQKHAWRRNRKKYEKGIKKWHNSTAGKRFHRQLSRFVMTRESVSMQYYYNKDINKESPTDTENKIVKMSQKDITQALVNLSSIETHLVLELEYYEPDINALSEFLELVELFYSDSLEIKQELLNAFSTGELNIKYYNDLTEIFQYFSDPKMYLYAKREELGLSNDKNSENSILLEEDLKFLNKLDNIQDLIEYYKKFNNIIIESRYETK